MRNPTQMVLTDNKFIFIISSTRSGTSWLNSIFQQHPSIATDPKFEIKHFNNYVLPWLNQWQKEKDNIKKYKWVQGLACLGSNKEFSAFINLFFEKVYLFVLKKNEQVKHILDKNLGYSFITREITELIPHSKFIHLILGRRDAVASMRSLHNSREFGGKNIHKVARSWNKLVSQARNAKALGSDKYLELSYEQLFEDTEKPLASVLGFCQQSISLEEINRIVSTTSMDKNPVSSGSGAVDYLRKQKDSIWRSQLSVKDKYVFNSMSGDAFLKLGYSDSKDFCIENPYHRLLPLARKVKKNLKTTAL